ncbi:MAG TPA: PAS domain S-box protein [Terriglobales bacterium]|nr:PAS domain S-box protein [Terriglobales bacterium]
MPAGNTTVLPPRSPRSDDSFQKLLLHFSEAAAQGIDSSSLIQLFCRETRQFFQVGGTYFWRCLSPDQLIGAEADGLMADHFRGTRLKANQSAVAAEAVRSRRTVYNNHVDPQRYPMAGEYQARSIMAAPLVVSNEVIGAAAFVHDSVSGFFNDDLAAKATILAGQLGSLLEARRLTQASREEHRRAEILAEVAHVLHGVPDVNAVIEALADRLRILLRTRLVCVLLRQEGPFELRAVAAETPALATSIRARHDRNALRFSADLAARAIAAGQSIAAAIDPESHALGDLVPSGMLIAAPFRTTRSQGAILVYPRPEGAFTPDEKSLVFAVTGFGAVAIANAELYSTAKAQAHELHQLLEISSELGSIGKLDQFMQAFVVRAADFLGFGRCCIGLLEAGVFHVRWSSDNGQPRPTDLAFPEGVASRALLNHEVFWSDDAARLPGTNLNVSSTLQAGQILAVPLLGADNQVIGMFAVLDRSDLAGISSEDIRRARALAAQVAVALEVTRNLHLSQQHRRRAEALTGLALELGSVLHVPDFARRFAARAATLMEASSAAVFLYQDSTLDIAAYHDSRQQPLPDPSTLRRFIHAIRHYFSVESGPSSAGTTAKHADSAPASAAPSPQAGQLLNSPRFVTALDLLDQELATALAWNDCLLVSLPGVSGEPVGVLCLANRSGPLSEEDSQLLQAIAGHASVALENARLFARIDQANRHWMEIFDSISDFIVVHDELHNVLRVNRPLAEFIGVPPSELVGLNMRALLAHGTDVPSAFCPFCRSDDSEDEYVHPVLERTYLVSTSRIHGDGNENLQTIHVLKDITDRREAERRYRELFDNVQEGLFFSTPDGRFIEVNEAMVRMLGYSSREELLHADIPTQIYFSPEVRQQLAELVQQQGSLRNHEAVLRRKDGSPMHVLINAFAVPDGHGRIMQYRGLMLDISGLKSFQAELQRERDFSSKILNHTQSLILVADTAGLISYANRRWFDVGYDQKQLLGRPLIGLVPAARRQALSDALDATMAGHQIDNLDLQVMRGDGRLGQFAVNLSPMRDEAGAVTSIVVVMTDITDAAMLQSKLIHAEKMAEVGQLVSGVAHEVNNPLTAILGFADLLMENPDLPDAARKDLRVILQEAQRTKQIVQNLLSFARQMPPQRKPVQLNSILRRTVQLRSYDFNSHGIEVLEQFDENLPFVVGDSHQLQQVFLNILNNAYDAVRETGRPARIEILTASLGSFVEVSFKDNGHGIAHPDRIFDPFFTTKEIGKGTGLGLSICYGIVREHGGEILCHNNVGAEGATFIVRLPIASETASSLGAAAGVAQR